MKSLKSFSLRLTSILFAIVFLASQFISCTKPDNTPVKTPDVNVDEEYTGSAYIVVNGNIPYFEAGDLKTESFEEYSELDGLGRCGTAFACIGPDIMPDPEEERESISSVKPSGWEYKGKSNNKQYDFIEGKYLYNRCHLIGYQLTGENANERNLITGTRYLNIDGMLPFENMVAGYVEETGNHVMYRVTPIFEDYNVIAKGVLMEGYSVEDDGEGICFCVFAYNVQPGIYINYYTGENRLSSESEEDEEDVSSSVTYVLNTDSKKYHLPTCTHAINLTGINRLEYPGAIADFETMYPGYSPCGTCKPHLN